MWDMVGYGRCAGYVRCGVSWSCGGWLVIRKGMAQNTFIIGKCTDLVNGFKCDCPRGYFDARCLSDVNECESNPCMNGGSCEDGVSQFICNCPKGYGGRRCELNIDECQSNPCQHGGTCRDALNNYTCTCTKGYSGRNCEVWFLNVVEIFRNILNNEFIL